MFLIGFLRTRLWSKQKHEASPGLAGKEDIHTGSPKQGGAGCTTPLSSALTSVSAWFCRLHLSLSHVLLCRSMDCFRDQNYLINNSFVDFLPFCKQCYNLDDKVVVSGHLV